jgi:hypothetical protein
MLKLHNFILYEGALHVMKFSADMGSIDVTAERNSLHCTEHRPTVINRNLNY